MPVPAATPASAFLAHVLSVRKTMASDHNGDETCDLRNSAGEKGLDRSESCIKGRSTELEQKPHG